MNRIVVLIAGLAAFLAAVASAPAQTDNLDVKIDAGFDGFYKPGSWFPIDVSIENVASDAALLSSSESFLGQVMVVAAPAESGPDGLRFVRAIEVPPASKKRYTLFAKFPTVPVKTDLLLTSENGKLLRTLPFTLNATEPGKVLLGLVTEAIARPFLPLMRGGLDSTIIARVSARSLPEHWSGLDSLDILLFPEWPATPVRPESIQAIRDWVTMGGTLLMLGGSKTQSYIGEEALELLPVTLLSTGRLTVSGGGGLEMTEYEPGAGDKRKTFVFTRSALKEGAEALASVDGAPLIARQRLGDGQIVFMAVDLESTDQALDRALAGAWHAIIPTPNLTDWDVEFPLALRNFQTLTGAAARPPNHFIIIVICILYTLVVGPINFAVLGKKKRLEWAWFTVPAIVMVFFVLIYGLGRLTKGGTSILREVSIERYQDGSNEGHSMTVTGAFVSHAGRYFFRPTKERHVIADPYRWHDWGKFHRGFEMTFGLAAAAAPAALSGSLPVIGYDTKMGFLFVNSWEMFTYDARNFVGRGPESMLGSLDSELTWESNRITGTVTNRTGRNFEKCWIVAGSDCLPIGELRDGATYTLNENQRLRRTPFPAQEQGAGVPWQDLSIQLAGLRTARPEADSDVNFSNAGTLLEAMFTPTFTGRVMPPLNGGVTFVGIDQQPEVENLITNVDQDVQSRARIAMVPLNVNPGDNFAVHPRYVMARLVRYESDNVAFRVRDDGNFGMENSSAVFSFELPFSHPDLTVSAFQVTPTVVRLDQSQIIRLEVYRHSPSAAWIEIAPGDVLQNGADFALPVSGRLFVRVTSQDSKKQSLGYDRETVLGGVDVMYQGTTIRGK